MTLYISLLYIIVFLSITILGSKYFYFMYLKYFTNKTLEKLNYNLKDLKYSYEEIIYFVPLPSNNPIISNSSRNDLYVKKELISPIYPSIKGIKVILKNKKDKDILIAYLAKDNFRLPTLDKLLFYKKIDINTYSKIVSYKLIHPVTIKEILDEIYIQLTKVKVS